MNYEFNRLQKHCRVTCQVDKRTSPSKQCSGRRFPGLYPSPSACEVEAVAGRQSTTYGEGAPSKQNSTNLTFMGHSHHKGNLR